MSSVRAYFRTSQAILRANEQMNGNGMGLAQQQKKVAAIRLDRNHSSRLVSLLNCNCNLCASASETNDDDNWVSVCFFLYFFFFICFVSC